MPAYYESNKAKICGVFARYVSAPNLVILRKHRGDPRAMWNALKAAHEVNTAGSRLFWLERLVSFRLESENILLELQRIESVAEHLGSLVTPARPLTVDEILSMVIATTLPSTFKPVITPLLQRQVISSVEILTAVREEVTRNSISESSCFADLGPDMPSKASSVKTFSSWPSLVASKQSRSDGDSSRSQSQSNVLPPCGHCGRKGHSIKTCRTKLAD